MILITGEKPNWAPANKSPDKKKTISWQIARDVFFCVITYEQNGKPPKMVKYWGEAVKGAQIGMETWNINTNKNTSWSNIGERLS